MINSLTKITLFFVTIFLILVKQVSANDGPKTELELIAKKLDPEITNKVGNSMSLEFWVSTSGEGESFFFLTTFLNADKPAIGSKYIWGTSMLKFAGTAVSYDVGLCLHQFTGDDEINVDQSGETWEVQDMWFTRVSPFKQKQNFAQLLETSKDTAQTGADDYKYNQDVKLRVETIERSKKLAMACPLYRDMNTYDYLDVKLEISLSYEIQGFYYMLNPPGSDQVVNEENHGFEKTARINILDSAQQAGIVILSIILGTASLQLF